MTRDDIIRMARQAANSVGSTVTPDLFGVTQIERFAHLIAAAERERIGQLVRGFFAAARFDRRHLGLGDVRVTAGDVDELLDSICTVKDCLPVQVPAISESGEKP